MSGGFRSRSAGGDDKRGGAPKKSARPARRAQQGGGRQGPQGPQGSQQRDRRPVERKDTGVDKPRVAAFDVLRRVSEDDAFANLTLPKLLKDRKISGRAVIVPHDGK